MTNTQLISKYISVQKGDITGKGYVGDVAHIAPESEKDKQMTTAETCKEIVAAVIRQAFADIEHGGETADKAVTDVENGGLDLWLSMLEQDISKEEFLEIAQQARIRKLEKRIAGRKSSDDKRT